MEKYSKKQNRLCYSKLRANVERSNKPSNLFYSFTGERRNIPRNKIDYV